MGALSKKTSKGVVTNLQNTFDSGDCLPFNNGNALNLASSKIHGKRNYNHTIVELQLTQLKHNRRLKSNERKKNHKKTLT